MRKLALFVALLVAADQVVGRGLDALYRRCTTGETGGLINDVLRRQVDVLVLGSSRAQHHVVPRILKRKLGLSAYNAGLDGQDLLYAVMLFDVWTAKHGAPKLVLLQVDPWSFRRSATELQRADIFAPFVSRSAEVRAVLALRGRYEPLKLLSYSYRFNGKVLAILKNALVRPNDAFDGYEGIPGAMTSGADVPASEDAMELATRGQPPWDRKLALFGQLAAYCRQNGTRLILFHSPRYSTDAPRLRAWDEELAALLKGYPDVDYIDGETQFARAFTGKSELFHDATHLNARGAELFTSLLAGEVAARLKKTRSVSSL